MVIAIVAAGILDAHAVFEPVEESLEFPARIKAAQHGCRRLPEQVKAAAQGFHIHQTYFFVGITPSRAM
ncbi:MAG: hypothetical protein OXN84_22230 [Albidovulum sp.]|nr:hypothetical protein [Albidovulum sp.]